ncbi:hypothetical protein BH18ACI5_BH18ACI5_06660 [soil metagenome]
MKRPGDTTPEPVGGRAAARLRMFEDARRDPADVTKPAAADEREGAPAESSARKRKASTEVKRRRPREKQNRRANKK